jgi:hypothetical protein
MARAEPALGSAYVYAQNCRYGAKERKNLIRSDQKVRGTVGNYQRRANANSEPSGRQCGPTALGMGVKRGLEVTLCSRLH